MAVGTPVEAVTETDYDAASNVVEVREPRYFDANDTEGHQKARMVSTYTRRNLVETATEAPGTPIAATVSYTYNDDGTTATVTDARGNPTDTVWSTCCRRVRATLDPAAVVDDSGTPKRAGRIKNQDHFGNVTHSAAVVEIANPATYNYLDPVDAETLSEVTTRYDARHRPTHRTVWLVPLGPIDPNNVPIAGEGGVPAGDGLTTRWTYDENLTDGVGLDAQFPGLLTGLNLGAGSAGSAVLVTNPEGERTISIADGTGRTLLVAQLDNAGGVLVKSTTSYDAIVAVAGFGDCLEIAQTDGEGNTIRSRSDGLGRTLEAEDALGQVTRIEYNSIGLLASRAIGGSGLNSRVEAESFQAT